jgi:coenzyme F420-0:L-glutamate ligase/coenzyme F420-1:gamma-L-glutamate ligase
MKTGRPGRLEVVALADVPLIRPGDDLAGAILAAVEASGLALESGDVLVIAQKAVSKAENRYVDLATVAPSPRARELAEATAKDPRVVELILGEAAEILRHRRGVIVVAHRLGYVLANAGIDASNVEPEGASERVLLLPEDPDASCERLRGELARRTGKDVGVIVNDSLGRAWRLGIVGTALGCAGLPAVVDLRGQPDLFGRPLQSTQSAPADELAAAASLLQGQADEGIPFVLVRGFERSGPPRAGRELVRPRGEDLLR